ncbi:Transcription termination factor MTERF6, chloroplastic/mitochondrial [Cardamine amara subsp. amara]|uniref:Transcription termination factor MTERF6, chloroplastic/mitochondrial n=1 Tax=Cardamine amara subsp. amara TaxID=228776 RepID=A0ABD1ANC5_CARAN
MHSTGKINVLAFMVLCTSSRLVRKAGVKNPLAATFTTRCSTLCLNEAEECIDGSELSVVSSRRIKSRKKVDCIGEKEKRANVSQLEFKLSLLKPLGITSSVLVKIVNCRPRFFGCRIHLVLDERINYFMKFLGSKEVLHGVIIRNPSLMLYDLNEKIKPAIEFYKGLGFSQPDLVKMLISRPTLIPRTNFNKDKFDYIQKTGVTRESKMFKYVAAIIRGFEDGGNRRESCKLGKCPILLTLSVEKVQRNMTFVIASMKLAAHSVLKYPFLLLLNLESHLRPRVDLVKTVMEIRLKPRIKDVNIFTALRMTEKRFLKVYVMCHQQDVAAELMEVYEKAKSMKRLAEKSKKYVRKGFPF